MPAELIAKRVSDTYLSGEVDGSLRLAERQAGCDSHSGDKLNNSKSDKDNKEPRPIKRKQPALS